MTNEDLAGMDAVETIRQIKGHIADWESGERNAVSVVADIAALIVSGSAKQIGQAPPPEVRT